MFYLGNIAFTANITVNQKNIQAEEKETNMNQKTKTATCCQFTAGCESSPPWQWDVWSCWPKTWGSWVCVTSRWADRWGLWASESLWCQLVGQPWHRWFCLQPGWRGTPQIPGETEEKLFPLFDIFVVSFCFIYIEYIFGLSLFMLRQLVLILFFFKWSHK